MIYSLTNTELKHKKITFASSLKKAHYLEFRTLQ